jgi:hypothetical protein
VFEVVVEVEEGVADSPRVAGSVDDELSEDDVISRLTVEQQEPHRLRDTEESVV